MPLAQIAVQIALSGELSKDSKSQSDSLRAALLAACSDAATVVQCVAADSAPEAVAVALVTFRGEGRVRIEVGAKAAHGDQWTAKDLHFAPKDDPVERWRAVGYAVGSLASALVDTDRQNELQQRDSVQPERGQAGDKLPPSSVTPKESTDAKVSDRPVAPPSTTPPAPQEADRSAAEPLHDRERSNGGAASRRSPSAIPLGWAEAGALVGPGLSASELRLGGFLRVSRSFGHPFATISASYSVESKNTRGLGSSWLSAALGAGYAANLARSLVVGARAEVALERLSVTVDETATGRTDEAAHWGAGLRAGADVALAIVDPVSLFLGAEMTIRLATTDITVGGTVTSSAPAVDYSCFAGLRLSWR